MTFEQVKQLAFGGSIDCNFIVSMPSMPSREVQGQPRDLIAHAPTLRPMTEADTNHLSIADVDALRVLKGKDNLHKQDTVAQMVNAGDTVREMVEKEGTDKFRQRYKKTK